MDGAANNFVDHYEAFGCAPAATLVELKKAYHEKLREFHPDKRPNSSTGTGARITQALLEAWEVFNDPTKREAYDELWRKHKEGSLPAAEQAQARRREGNELYKAAQALSKAAGPESLSAAAQALKQYQAAIGRYTEGVELDPQDHRLRSNRALCYAALKDWTRCQQDAESVVKLRPDFMKGWFLLAKALWKQGSPLEAQRQLDHGLSLLPGSAELLALGAEMAPDVEACRSEGCQRLPKVSSGRASRNVSPACTPPQGNSRVATPPRSTPRRSERSGERQRKPSKSPGPPGDKYEQTAHFGEDTFAERTARFGASCSRGPRLPGQARSTSPVQLGERSCGTDAQAEATIGTFGPPGAAPIRCPPPAQGPFSARPDPVDRAQSDGTVGASKLPPAPGRRIGTLQGMAVASRVASERARGGTG